MTIGADTALHRIVEAMDALRSTASSHQRTFVVEVMGRHCGYLALMASLATAANWLLIPEQPPDEDWAQQMCRDIKAGRDIGRRQSVVIVAEGAHDTPRQSDHRRPDQDRCWSRNSARTPGSRSSATCSAVARRARSTATWPPCSATPPSSGCSPTARIRTPQLIGLRGNRVVTSPLMDCVAQTQAVAERIKAQDFDGAMLLRGGSFRRVLQDPADHPAGRAAADTGGPATFPARDRARRRTGAGDEQRGARRRPTRPGPRLHGAGDTERIPRAARRRHPGDGLDGRQRLGVRRRRRDRHQPVRAQWRRDRADRRTGRRTSDRRPADGRWMGRLPGRARAAPASTCSTRRSTSRSSACR